MYYLCFGVLVVVALVVARLRRTGIGRSMIAVRDNEDMAAASTVATEPHQGDVVRRCRAASPRSPGRCSSRCASRSRRRRRSRPEESLLVVATAVIGGLGSIVGPVIGALWVRGLPVVFNDTAQVRLFTSSIGLLVLLMYFPGGLLQIAYKLRDAVLQWADAPARRSRCRAAGSRDRQARSHPRRRRDIEGPGVGAVVGRCTSVGVHFGGNHAVDDVSLERERGRARRLDRHERRRQVDADECDRRVRPVDRSRSRCSGATSARCPRTAGTGSGSAAGSSRRACTRP